jgi:hypothetical protein
MLCGCVSVSLISCSCPPVSTFTSASSLHFSRPSQLAATAATVNITDSVGAVRAGSDGQRVETRVAELVAKQASLQHWLKLLMDESAVNRENIVLTFGKVREALESAERAALVAYDEEVRRVVKSCEAECEGVEVLSQQLSACVLACGGGVTMCDSVGDSEAVGKEGSVSVRSVNVVLCEEGLCEALERCWSLVSVPGGDSEEQALALAEAEASLNDTVSAFGICSCSFEAIILRLAFLLCS